MQAETSWDPLIRVFHWSLVATFTLNAFILDEDSKAHEVVGFMILGLVAFRLFWGLVGSPNARFSAFPPSPSAAFRHLGHIARGIPDRTRSHNPLSALMVYNLLLVLAGLGITGWMMTSITFWGVKWVEEVHELLAAWAIFSVAVHIVAVVFESYRSRVNLVKAMVTGTKEFADDRQP